MRYILSALVFAIFWAALGSSAARAGTRRAVLLVALDSEAHSAGSEEQDARALEPLARVLRSPFETLGIAFVGVTRIVESPSDSRSHLPAFDAAASALAGRAGAGIAVIAGLRERGEGRVRGTLLVGRVASLRIRVLDVASGELLFERQSQAAAYGKSAPLAIVDSRGRAASGVTRGLRKAILQRWPDLRSMLSGSVTLQISGATRWGPVFSLLSRLASIQGVSDVQVLSLHRGLVKFSLRSLQGIGALAASFRQAHIRGISLVVESRGLSLVIKLEERAIQEVVGGVSG